MKDLKPKLSAECGDILSTDHIFYKNFVLVDLILFARILVQIYIQSE